MGSRIARLLGGFLAAVLTALILVSGGENTRSLEFRSLAGSGSRRQSVSDSPNSGQIPRPDVRRQVGELLLGSDWGKRSRHVQGEALESCGDGGPDADRIRPTSSRPAVQIPTRSVRGLGESVALLVGLLAAGRKENTMTTSSTSQDSGLEWYGQRELAELEHDLLHAEHEPVKERIRIIEEWEGKYAPPPEVQIRADALLADPDLKTLRRRITLRRDHRLEVFGRLSNRFDSLLVALRRGIELAADGSYWRNEAGAEAVLKFLAFVGCFDAFHPKNRRTLRALEAKYAGIEPRRVDPMWI